MAETPVLARIFDELKALGKQRSDVGGSQFLFYGAQLLENLVGALGFLGIDTADGETDMDHNVVSNFRLRHEPQSNLAGNRSELDLANVNAGDVFLCENLARDR
jgi:hypothetical protein